jgi:hypothetical protein
VGFGRFVLLTELLSGSVLSRPPRRVAQKELVAPSASQGCSVRVGQPIRLAKLFGLIPRWARHKLWAYFGDPTCRFIYTCEDSYIQNGYLHK